MGFLGFLTTSIVSMFIIGGMFVLIDVTNQYAPNDPIAQDAAHATTASANWFRPVVQLDDLWYFIGGFGVLLILSVAYKVYSLSRSPEGEN